MTKNLEAVRQLARFDAQLRWTVQAVVTNLGLPYDSYEQVRQQAEILVVTYADLLDEPTWGSGRLSRWERLTCGDEASVKKLVGRQLRVDLHQIFIRILRCNGNESDHTISAEEVVGTPAEPADEFWEDRELEKVSGRFNEAGLMRRYPNLARNVLDGVTQEAIAEEAGVTRVTVARWIAREKVQFLMDCVTSRGLAVAGDETLDELTEAYQHLSKSRWLWLLTRRGVTARC